MAATDAIPVPRKNTAYRFTFAIRKPSDSTLITTWTGTDSEVSLDGAAFSDCTNEATEIGTSGIGYIDLTAAEMNADTVILKVTVTNTGAVPLVFTFLPESAGDYRADVVQWLGTAPATPTVAGVPEVDLTHIAGDSQSATDLKDFADAGYDPVANKVQGVVLVDVTTNLTNERGKYALGAVWIGPSPNTNTVSYVDGIITNPVSTLTAAKTIADALGLRRFFTVRTGSTQIAAAIVGYDLEGDAWTVTTTGGSRDVGTSTFVNAIVSSGTFAGTSGQIYWRNCEFGAAVSVGISHMFNCEFDGTLTLSEAGDYEFIDCALSLIHI